MEEIRPGTGRAVPGSSSEGNDSAKSIPPVVQRPPSRRKFGEPLPGRQVKAYNFLILH